MQYVCVARGLARGGPRVSGSSLQRRSACVHESWLTVGVSIDDVHVVELSQECEAARPCEGESESMSGAPSGVGAEAGLYAPG